MQAQNLVQGFWSGSRLSAINRACLRSFIGRGHQYVLYSYDAPNVPDGVIVRDANEILPSNSIFHFQNPATHSEDIGPFADYFRLKLLVERGGWYCDVDTVCLASELPIGTRVWAREALEFETNLVGNGQLFFEAGDPIATLMLNRCESMLSNFDRREALGPVLLSSVVGELGLPQDMYATPQEFYPLRWIESFKLWLPEFTEEIEERVKHAVFLPVYQSLPKYIGLDISRIPPKGSYLGRVVDDFAPELTGGRYDADEVRDAIRRWFKSAGPWATRQLVSIRGTDVLTKLDVEADFDAATHG